MTAALSRRPHLSRRTQLVGLALAGLAAASTVAAPSAVAQAAEAGPACMGFDVLEVSPGLSATESTSGTVNHVGPLGEEFCTGDALGYKATGPIGIEHYINYSGTCAEPVLEGYALHHVPTADGVKTFRNNFTATLGAFQGDKFSGNYAVVPLEGDCVSAPLTKFRADYVGHFNDNTRD